MAQMPAGMMMPQMHQMPQVALNDRYQDPSAGMMMMLPQMPGQMQLPSQASSTVGPISNGDNRSHHRSRSRGRDVRKRLAFHDDVKKLAHHTGP